MTTADRSSESAPAPPRRQEGAATPIYISERVRNLLLLALLGVLLLLFWAAPGALVALGGGAFLAVLFSIPVNQLARVLPRGLAVLGFFLGLVALLAVLLFLVVPPLLAELGAFIQAVPQYAAQADTFLRTEILEPLQARGLLSEG